MKQIIFPVLFLFTIISCAQTEKSAQEKNIQSYGEKIDTSLAKDVSILSTLMTNSDSVAITLTGTIEKTCAVKGCWMQLKTDDNNSLRVTFKDYGFFVPKKGVEGKIATIQGYCVKQETSIEELRHYARDADESEEVIAAINSPRKEYNFIAAGVIIQE